MRSVLYRLEDHFEAAAEIRRGRLSRHAFLLLSLICGGLGDALEDRTQGRSMFTLPD
jgi:hypothetical protein